MTYLTFINAIVKVVAGYMEVKLEQHVGGIKRDIKFVVEEIEALYDQTNALMVANLV